MKTKLLKKVRKRFEIIHYPNGINNILPCERAELIDKHTGKTINYYYISGIGITTPYHCKTVIDAKKRLIENLMFEIRYSYGKNKKKKGIKLWHS